MNEENLTDNVVAQENSGLGTIANLDSLIQQNLDGGIHFHFPVVIEVRQSQAAINVDAIVETTLNRLADSLGSE